MSEVRPETVTVQLDRERHLRLDFQALRNLCRDGITADPLKMLNDLVRIENSGDGQIQVFAKDLWALQVLLWAGLRTEDSDLTLEQTEVLITEAVQAGRATLGDLALGVWSSWHAGGLGVATKKKESETAQPIQ